MADPRDTADMERYHALLRFQPSFKTCLQTVNCWDQSDTLTHTQELRPVAPAAIQEWIVWTGSPHGLVLPNGNRIIWYPNGQVVEHCAETGITKGFPKKPTLKASLEKSKPNSRTIVFKSDGSVEGSDYSNQLNYTWSADVEGTPVLDTVKATDYLYSKFNWDTNTYEFEGIDFPAYTEPLPPLTENWHSHKDLEVVHRLKHLYAHTICPSPADAWRRGAAKYGVTKCLGKRGFGWGQTHDVNGNDIWEKIHGGLSAVNSAHEKPCHSRCWRSTLSSKELATWEAKEAATLAMLRACFPDQFPTPS